MILIEKAQTGDCGSVLMLLEDILRIHHSGRPDIFASSGAKYTAENLESIFSDPDTPSFVIREDGEFRGYALCQIKRSKGTPPLCPSVVLYIDDLCVSSDQRGRGLGSALLEHIIKTAKELGCCRVELNVWEFNEGARRLYERFGFSTQKRQLEYLL